MQKLWLSTLLFPTFYVFGITFISFYTRYQQYTLAYWYIDNIQWAFLSAPSTLSPDRMATLFACLLTTGLVCYSPVGLKHKPHWCSELNDLGGLFLMWQP